MSDKLMGIISSEGALEGVIEDDNLNVKVQITESGPRGLPGSDGYTPIKGIDYFDGKDGKDGYSPKLGVDYFTLEDKEKLLQEVKEGIGTCDPSEGGSLIPMTEEELRSLF